MPVPWKQQLIALAVLVTAATLSACGDSDNDGGTPAPTLPPAATNTPKSTATQGAQPSVTPARSTPTPSATATRTTASQPTATQGAGGSGKIVFGAVNDQFISDLFVINADGSGRINVTNTAVDSETQPSWSPDGTKILYRLNDNMIAVINADGSERRIVITTTGPLYYPAWNADASKIVFVADDDIATQHDNTIDVVNTDGSGHMVVVAQKGDYLSPTFNPDGGKIALGTNTGSTIEIAMVNSDGTDYHLITNDGTSHDRPAWSPTGTDIAYASADPVTFEGGIYLVRPDGTDARLLYMKNGASNAAWNRNGSKLAYGVFFEGIGIVNADGTAAQTVPNTSDGVDPDLD